MMGNWQKLCTSSGGSLHCPSVPSMNKNSPSISKVQKFNGTYPQVCMHRIAVSQCNPNQKSLLQNKSYWIQSRLPTPISGALQSGKITVAPTILLLMAAMVNEGGQDDQPQIKPMPSYESPFSRLLTDGRTRGPPACLHVQAITRSCSREFHEFIMH